MPSIRRGIEFLFGQTNEQRLRKLLPVVEEVNGWADAVAPLSDADLAAKTTEFRDRLVSGEMLDELLPEAFACVREAAWRTIGLRPFDVQVMGATVLHRRRIAEMKTGEGKTLVATMPAYLNALAGKVHIVTVNDYLARRDRGWMGPVYEFMGLTVGLLQETTPPEERQAAYACDILYGTNAQFGFDYLRDHLVTSRSHRVQGSLDYAIVDEIDNILIDEARTPLIISGPAEVSSSAPALVEMNRLVPRLVKKQESMVGQLLAEAGSLRSAGEDLEAGTSLLQVKQGAPKNAKLSELLQDREVRALVDRAERAAMVERSLSGIQEKLFYYFDEQRNMVSVTPAGYAALDPSNTGLFDLPDLIEGSQRIDADESLSPDERSKRRDALEKESDEARSRIEVLSLLLRAYALFKKDVDYVVADGKVVIVDQFTGRLMPGRRYSGGLHEAIEVKEGVPLQRESQTLAQITLQHYFKLYGGLAGMTGTAKTEEDEFKEIYGLEVVQIPTNRPLIREALPDVIYRTKKGKFEAVADEVVRLHKEERPVLIGTTSIEDSEDLSRLLKKRGLPHQVLNAKYHEREAHIIAQAGRRGEITIATNMAGRGTDIVLGGSPEFRARAEADPDEELDKYRELLERYRAEAAAERDEIVSVNGDDPAYRKGALARIREWCAETGRPFQSREWEGAIKRGGLAVLGFQRHEARRIDDQLAGRSGRQGDPGSSQFFMSLEDDLLRVFGGDRLATMMEKLRVEEGEAITHDLLTRSIRRAQKRVEERNFEIRKRLLEYDLVMARQRDAVYSLLDRFLVPSTEEVKETDLREYDKLLMFGYPDALPAGESGSSSVEKLAEELDRGIVPRELMKALRNETGTALPGHVGAEKLDEETWLVDRYRVEREDNRFRVYETLDDYILGMVEEFAEVLVDRYVPASGAAGEGDAEGLSRDLAQICYHVPELPLQDREALRSRVVDILSQQFSQQRERLSPYFPPVARNVAVMLLHRHWRQHLLELDELREGIGLRAYGGTNPEVEYKREAFRLFQEMTVRFREEVLRLLLNPRLSVRAEPTDGRRAPSPPVPMTFRASSTSTTSTTAPPVRARPAAPGAVKTGRNDPCPCGSGKKYKHCHGR